MQRSFTDHLNRTMTISYPPKRIVSLVPSQTELLFELGLRDEVIGLTRFCVHPADQVQGKVKVGGTRQVDVDAIRSLKPDLIIGNKEENDQAQMELLAQEFPVWISDVHHLEDAQRCITDIGMLVGREPEAAYLNHLIHAGFRDLQTLALQRRIHKTAVYLIWRKPFMAAGSDTFIHDILAKNGLRNVVSDERYPELNLEAIASLNPELVLLSSEPYPFKEQHMEELRMAVPSARIMLIDGEMCSWHGSRLVKAVQYFFQLQQEF